MTGSLATPPLYRPVHDASSQGDCAHPKGILSKTSTTVIRQLELDENTPTIPLNAAILRRYEDRHIVKDLYDPARPW